MGNKNYATYLDLQMQPIFRAMAGSSWGILLCLFIMVQTASAGIAETMVTRPAPAASPVTFTAPVQDGPPASSPVKDRNPQAPQKFIIEYDIGSVAQQLKPIDLKKSKNKSVLQRIESVKRDIQQYHTKFSSDLQQLDQQYGKQKNPNGISAAIIHQYAMVYAGAAVKLPRDLILKVKELPYVVDVHPDYQVEVNSDSVRETVGGVRLTNNRDLTGDGVDVAILDSGVDYMHEALGGGIGDDYRVKGGFDLIHLDNDPMDDYGHGTKIASVLAGDGKHKGIAPEANLYAYKVLGEDGKGVASDVVAALERAVNQGVDVINMSLGGPGGVNSPMAKAVNRAVRAGIIVVASAGNQGDEYWTMRSPGVSELAITVGASSGDHFIADFSSRGPTPQVYHIKPDIVAPGVGVPAALVGGGYTSSSGTSISAPVVAGAAALLHQAYPDRAPKHIKSMMLQSAKDMHADIWSQGRGLLQVDKAYERDVTMAPSQISFGIMSENTGIWTGKDTVAIYNLSERSVAYELEMKGDQSGIEYILNRDRLTIDAGDSARVALTVRIDNDMVGFREDQPLDFTGWIQAVNNRDTLRVPWSVIKVPHLRIQTRFNGYVYLHAHKQAEGGGTKRSELYSPSLDENFTWTFLDNTPYNIIAEYVNPWSDNYEVVVKEGMDVASLDTLQILPGEAIHPLELEPVNANGSNLDGKDALLSFKRLKHKTGFTISRNVASSLVETSTMSDEYVFEGMSFYRKSSSASALQDYLVSYFRFKGINGDKQVTNQASDYASVTYEVPSFKSASNINFSIQTDFQQNLLTPPPSFRGYHEIPKSYTLHYLPYNLSPRYTAFDTGTNQPIFQSARHSFGKEDSVVFRRGEYRYKWHPDNLTPVKMNHVLPFFSAGINSDIIWTGKDKGFFHDAFGGLAGMPGEAVFDIFVKMYRKGEMIFEKRVPDGQFSHDSVSFPLPQQGDWLEVTTERDNYFVERKPASISARYYFGGSNSGTGPKISQLRLTSDGKYDNVLSFRSENMLRLRVNQRFEAVSEKMQLYNSVDSMVVRYRQNGKAMSWKRLAKSYSSNSLQTPVGKLKTGYYDLKIDIFDARGNRLVFQVEPAFKFVSSKRRVEVESTRQPENTYFNVTMSTPDSLGYEQINGFEFNLSYADSLLNFVSMDLASPLNEYAQYEVQEDSGGTLQVSVNATEPIRTKGDLLSLTFKTRRSNGYSPLHIEQFSYSQSELDIEASHGEVRVLPVILGDITKNREITAYDASMVLQHTHGVRDLSDLEQMAANVGGSDWITSQDAITILRRVVGQISSFPVRNTRKQSIASSYGGEKYKVTNQRAPLYLGETNLREWFGNSNSNDSTALELTVPLHVRNLDGVRSVETEMQFDSDDLEFQSVDFAFQSPWLGKFNFDEETNRLNIAGAGPSPLSDHKIAEIVFKLVKDNSSNANVGVEGTARVNESSPGRMEKTNLLNIPDNVTLNQNYPNPFNPTTTISYGLPQQGHVRLEVYNIQGKKVATLVNQNRQPGMHEVQFNGSQLASGVYIYTLHTPFGTKTEKFTLLK